MTTFQTTDLSGFSKSPVFALVLLVLACGISSSALSESITSSSVNNSSSLKSQDSKDNSLTSNSVEALINCRPAQAKEKLNDFIEREKHLIDLTNRKNWEGLLKYADQIGADKTKDKGLQWVYRWCRYKMNPNKYSKNYVEAFPTQSGMLSFLFDLEYEFDETEFDLYGALCEIAKTGNQEAIDKILNFGNTDGMLSEIVGNIIADVFFEQPEKMIETWIRIPEGNSDYHHYEYLAINANNNLEDNKFPILRDKLKKIALRASGEKKVAVDRILKDLKQ